MNDVDLAHKGLRSHSAPRPGKVRTTDKSQTFRVERARYAKGEDAYRFMMQRTVRAHLSGQMSEKSLVEAVSKEMYSFYSRMYVLGRRSTGNVSSTLSRDEQAWLHGQHSNDMRYFHNYLSDIRSGKGRMAYDQRADLYGLGGWSVYIMGAISSHPEATFHWVMNSLAESCQECMARSIDSKKKGGFSYSQLLKGGLPGTLRCGHRCRCGVIVEVDGQKIKLARTRPTSFKHASSIKF